MPSKYERELELYKDLKELKEKVTKIYLSLGLDKEEESERKGSEEIKKNTKSKK